MGINANQKLVELLQELVRIPSVNPEGHDAPEVVGEARLAEFLATYLSDRGFEVQWDERESGRPNVIGRFGPSHPERTLLIEAHLDTVSVRGMTRPPFDAVVEDGRLYGRGACDTKGPMAAALWPLQPHLLEKLTHAGVALLFVGAMGEEKGNKGAERLVTKGLVQADEAIILEPTNLSLVHAHKGSLWYAIEVTGTPGHGSNPDGGPNAILGMQAVMDVLHKEVDEQCAWVTNRLLGPPTLNMGRIEGGTAINIVAPTCRLEVDRRTLPEENHEEILGRVHDGLERLKAEQVINQYNVKVLKDGAPYRGASDSGLVQRMSAACVQHDVAPTLAGTPWYSDAGPLARVCDDVVVFGPGSIAQAHTENEYIELDSLQKGAEILKTFLQATPGKNEPA